jgi:hypothetical protein
MIRRSRLVPHIRIFVGINVDAIMADCSIGVFVDGVS